MAPLNWLLVGLYTALTIIALGSFRGISRIAPMFWFVVAQWIMAVTTISIADLDLPSDLTYALLYIVALVSFMIGVLGYAGMRRVRSTARAFWLRPVERDPAEVRALVRAMLLVAVGVTILYYQLLGYNLFVDILLGRGIDDYSALRLAAYSGDQYFAPGYVNQFKNVLLPLCVLVLVAWAVFDGSRRRARLLVAVGAPFCLYALLGTGQRAFLVYTFVAALFGIRTLTAIPRRYLMAVGSVVTAAFALMTFYYQRSQISDSLVFDLVRTMAARLFYLQQEGGLVGFRYVYELDVVWFREWFADLAGILPSNSGSSLAHDVHELMYGSSVGTVPVSTVGSAYYNGGVVAVVGMFVALGVAYTALYDRFVDGRRTIARCLTYGALFFYLSIFVSGGPSGPINDGVITLMVVLWLRKIRLWSAMGVARAPTPSEVSLSMSSASTN